MRNSFVINKFMALNSCSYSSESDCYGKHPTLQDCVTLEKNVIMFDSLCQLTGSDKLTDCRLKRVHYICCILGECNIY
jgi:hypothetical protein